MKKLDRFICSIWHDYLRILINCLIFRDLKCYAHAANTTSFLHDLGFCMFNLPGTWWTATMWVAAVIATPNGLLHQWYLIRKWLFGRHFNELCEHWQTPRCRMGKMIVELEHRWWLKWRGTQKEEMWFKSDRPNIALQLYRLHVRFSCVSSFVASIKLVEI